MSQFQFFWDVVELCDWSCAGEDDKVLQPVIRWLADQQDSRIYQFDDLMSELLHGLDTKELAAQCRKSEPLMSDDSFLYSCCVALMNGPDYYRQAKEGKRKEIWGMEFESLLYVPSRAWAMKHGAPEEEYPHSTSFGIEADSIGKQ